MKSEPQTAKTAIRSDEPKTVRTVFRSDAMQRILAFGALIVLFHWFFAGFAIFPHF